MPMTTHDARPLHPLVLAYDPRTSRVPICTRPEWEAVRQHVIELVAAAPEASGPGVRRYLTVTTRLAVHAFRNGWGLAPEIVLSPQVVEHFVASLAGSPATCRALLRRLAAAHGLPSADGGVAYARREVRSPYEPSEVEALWRFASALSDRSRRVSLSGLLVLGAGFGLARGDLRGVTAAQLHRHDRRLHVTVPADGRCVPVASGWASRARQVADARPSGQLIGVPSGRNLTDRHVGWVGDRAGVPRLAPDRLRARWIVDLIAAGTGLPDLLAWSGVKGADALDTYLPHVPQVRSRPGCAV
jgi:hypothetical protein